jgi:hypothetical protein
MFSCILNRFDLSYNIHKVTLKSWCCGLIFLLREEEDRHINLLRYRLYGDDSSDEAKEKSKVIKAHQVPLKSQLPLFDKILADQENRYTSCYLMHLKSVITLTTNLTCNIIKFLQTYYEVILYFSD